MQKDHHLSMESHLQGRSTLPADLPSKTVCPLQDRMAVQSSAGLRVELQPCVVVPSATVLLAIPICVERFVHHAEAGPGCLALRLGLYEVITILLTRPRLDKSVIALFAYLPSKTVCSLQDRMAVQNSAGLRIEMQPCIMVPSATIPLAVPICIERLVHHAEAGPGCLTLRLGLYEEVTILLTRPRLDKHVIALLAYLPGKPVCALQDRMAVQNSAGLRIELQPCIMVPRATIPLAIPTCSERSAHHPELGPGCLALRLGGYELVAIIVARAKLDEYVQGRTGSAA